MKAPYIKITIVVVVVVVGVGVGGGLVGHWVYGLNPRSSLSEWMSVIEKKDSRPCPCGKSQLLVRTCIFTFT